MLSLPLHVRQFFQCDVFNVMFFCRPSNWEVQLHLLFSCLPLPLLLRSSRPWRPKFLWLCASLKVSLSRTW